MTDRSAIKLIHNILQDKSKWYIDSLCPDIDKLQDICEEAARNADYELSRMTSCALYQRYRKWMASDPVIGIDEEHFDAFMNHVVWDMGRQGLKEPDKSWFEDMCELKFKYT